MIDASLTRQIGAVLTTLLALLFCRAALAHDPNLSGIVVRVAGGQTRVSVTAASERLDPKDRLGDLKRRLELEFDGKPFVASGGNLEIDGAGLAAAEFSSDVAPAKLTVHARLFPDDAGARTAVSVLSDGRLAAEALLDNEHGSVTAELTEDVSMGAVAVRYLKEGVLHIFGGFDHVLFVCGLLLAGGSIGRILKVVTGFTIAHSITLTLAALSIVAPSPRLVEPLIALSIVVIAAENLRKSKRAAVAADTDTPAKPPADYRPILAFGFGMIHGFGFAGALAEVRIPTGALVPALAAFNVGVEIGQATIILCLFPVLSWLAKSRPSWHRGVTIIGSIGIAAAGAVWFVQRIMGG